MTIRAHRDDARLAMLMTEVRRARAAFAELRDQPATPHSQHDLADLVVELVAAMESYADAAAASGVPLPYRYRDDFQLYRALARVRPGPNRSDPGPVGGARIAMRVPRR